MSTTVLDLVERLRSEADAYLFLEELRWGDGETECSHCGNLGAPYIEPSNGHSRKTRTGAMSQRRVWRCFSLRRQFSVLTGTSMHGTKIPVRTWVLVIFEMCASKDGVAAREIERKYGLRARTAWFLMHRIREAMKDDGLTMFSGVVIADETYVGGAFKNMHKSKFKNYTAGRAGGPYDKTPVLSLIDADSGQVRSRVLPRVDGSNLRKAIAAQVDMSHTILHTDTGRFLQRRRSRTCRAPHRSLQGRRVRPARGSRHGHHEPPGRVLLTVEALHRRHPHHVSTEHLGRYLAEFDYRHTTRDMTDTERMADLLGQVAGRRLTYKRATA